MKVLPDAYHPIYIEEADVYNSEILSFVDTGFRNIIYVAVVRASGTRYTLLEQMQFCIELSQPRNYLFCNYCFVKIVIKVI